MMDRASIEKIFLYQAECQQLEALKHYQKRLYSEYMGKQLESRLQDNEWVSLPSRDKEQERFEDLQQIAAQNALQIISPLESRKKTA